MLVKEQKVCILDQYVLNVEEFMEMHPGGEDLIRDTIG
jgi:cytochrome b involved in lipid metabolism